MPGMILDRTELAQGTRSPQLPGLDIGITLAQLQEKNSDGGSCLGEHHLVPQQFFADDVGVSLVEPEEILVLDPRGALTPVQMVDQKLLALLGNLFFKALSPGSDQGAGHADQNRGPRKARSLFRNT